jgi:hypothetical protein
MVEPPKLSDADHRRVACVLEAGGIRLEADVEARAIADLCRLVSYLVHTEQRDCIGRPTKRFNDSGREIRGRKPDRVGNQIVDGLAELWTLYTGNAATISYTRPTLWRAARYTGPFLRMVQAFAAMLLGELKAHPAWHANATDELLSDLQQLTSNGRKAYDRLRERRKTGRVLPPLA